MDLNFNQDGSVDLPIDGKPIRFVRESDLLAVKGGSDAKTKEWENEKATFSTQLAEANRLRDETHQQLLQERASRELMTSKYSDYDTFKTKVGELEKELGTHKESVGKYEKELAGRIRHNLINIHGAKEDAIKDKDLTQLRNLEEAASLFGGKAPAKPARYDGGSGGPAGIGTESALDRAKRIIEESEKKRGKVTVSNIAIK